jgi:hypothetical protein
MKALTQAHQTRTFLLLFSLLFRPQNSLTPQHEKIAGKVATAPSHANKRTGITLSGDEIIGQLYQPNMQLIPFAISPLGLFGPTMNTFLYGTDPMTHAIEPRLFPYDSKMAKRSISNAVPSNTSFTEQMKFGERNTRISSSKLKTSQVEVVKKVVTMLMVLVKRTPLLLIVVTMWTMTLVSYLWQLNLYKI